MSKTPAVLSPMFTLRRLELAQGLVQRVQDGDSLALVQLAALAMADEDTLKLASAGNKDALGVYAAKAYDMNAEEVAALLAGFIRGSERFTLALRGLSPEEISRHMTKAAKTLRGILEIESPEESPENLADTK